MGLINFGVPEKEVAFLKEKMNLDTFVEGGTFQGGTAKKMSESFRKVFTIEKSNIMFETAKKNLGDISNIALLKGDTREHLETILDENNNIIFWLDAHWSGGDTYGEEDECPLIEELKIIFKYQKNYMILIDDARLFLAPPPSPHNFHNWPSLKNIVDSLPINYEMIVFEDVIYIYDDKYDSLIKHFIQEEVTRQWRQHGVDTRVSFRKGLKTMIRGLLPVNFIKRLM